MECHHHQDGKTAQITQCRAGLGHAAADRPLAKSTAIIAPRLEGPAAFSDRFYYAVIRRPDNEQLPAGGENSLPLQQKQGWSRRVHQFSLTGPSRAQGRVPDSARQSAG